MSAVNGSTADVWKTCLRSLAHHEAWVKGAVNYDEDLHFSTYYLRASCAEVTASLYPGYSSIVASYDGFNETYYLLKSECRASAIAIVEKALRKPEWLPGILAQIRRGSDALADIFPIGASASSLERLTTPRLLALYQRHHERNQTLYRYARLPEALDRGNSYFTEYLMQHLRDVGLSAADCSDAFNVLSESTAPSVLAQEILEFNGIVQFASAHPGNVPPATDGPGRARMFLDPAVFQRLDAHRRKWQFLPYHGYGRRQLATVEQYVERLTKQISMPDVLANGSGLIARGQRAVAERQKLLRKLKVDNAHAALFNIYAEIGTVKLYRRHAQLRNFYFLDMLLAECARRLKVSEWTVRCMLPEEIMESLAKGRLSNPAILDRLGGCVFAILNGREQIVTGKKMLATREHFQAISHPHSDANVLRGVVACRGKAAGPCKIIIRADDNPGELVKGTILVSESTDPDLVRLLRSASGILTEQGGVTSHAAIICRELCIPTIIGIDGLLQRVRDGDWIEMDAELGTVIVVPKHKHAGKNIERVAIEQSSAKVIGSKAYNMGLVRSHGFRVPDYVLLDSQQVLRLGIRIGKHFTERLLKELAMTQGEKLAVRSSAVSEDRDDGSCAGKYRSLLNVGQGQLCEALRDFAKSNELSRDERKYKGSVIIQKMVQANCSGVCLTRDNRTGNRDAVIIEMTAGGNSGVTAGTVRPDRLIVDRLTGDILDEERRSDALHKQAVDIGSIVRHFLTLELRFGKPLDIEWALVNGELYILQARPIVETQCSN